jgi:acyl-CoA thioester hydrolase
LSAPALFTRRFHVRWGDMDFNAHMRNTAYLDLAADVRMLYFQQSGFTMREFERLGVGPVVLKDEVEYLRELRLLDPVEVTLALAGVSADGARFRLRNEFATPEGTLVARVTSTGGWLDWRTRKRTPPPVELSAAMMALARTADFEPMPSLAATSTSRP